jgi:hypothetical protein
MNAKFSIRRTALAAIILVLSTGHATFGEEMSAGAIVLRGTPPRAQPQQTVQKIEVAPPPLPTCPHGYFYSLLAGLCYQLRDPTVAY